MQKILITAAVLIAVGAVIFALKKPEPTPAEKLSDAVQDVGEAAQDVVEELAAAADETVDAAKKEADAKSEDLQEQAASALEAAATKLNAMSEETRAELEGLLQDWRNSGIVNDGGIDFDAAVEAVNTSELDAGTKAKLVDILTFIRDLPGDLETNLRALEQSL